VKKIYSTIISVIVPVMILSSCQKPNELQRGPQTQSAQTQQQAAPQVVTQTSTASTTTEQMETHVQGTTQPEENVPLISEVMTKEELLAYLKEKSIPIITKENFKEPELVWERTFDDPIAHIYAISDLTEKGNCIVTTGKGTFKTKRKLLFLDSKGGTRKKVVLGEVGENTFAVARGGKATVVGTIKNNILTKLTYYDEEGNIKWDKEYVLIRFKKLTISDNGESIAIEEYNPKWSIEEWSMEGDLNISKVIILNSGGKQIYEYKNFRNLGWGEFSGDGKYYAGLFWWQRGFNSWGKLIYVNVKEGKIAWERPFGGNYLKWSEMFDEDRNLAISQHGGYVAAVDMVPAEKMPKEGSPFEHFEIAVFDRTGKKVARIKDQQIYSIMDNGFALTGNRSTEAIANILHSKFLLKPKDYTHKSEYRPDPMHPGTVNQQFIERPPVMTDVNFKKYIILSTRVHDNKDTSMVENFAGDIILEKKSLGFCCFMPDGKYFLSFGGQNNHLISIYKSNGVTHE
jgi:hypothetical protein